jgi:hypothetical protein
MVPFLIGLGLLVFGLVSVGVYYGHPKPQTIGGNEVMEASHCSQSYAVGSCPVVSYDWTGTLVYPSPGAAGGLVDIWKLQGTSLDTCGLPATYLLNLPGPNNATSANPNEPPYVPLGQGIEGVITYGTLVYAYTSATYTFADGCSGTNLSSAPAVTLQGTITYTSDGTRTLVLGSNTGYNFSSLNWYMTALLSGGFLVMLGFFLAFASRMGLYPEPKTQNA